MKVLSPKLLWSCCLLSISLSSLHAEPIQPDAGQTLQNLQNIPVVTPQGTTQSPVLIDDKLTADSTSTRHDVRFMVNKIHVKGSTVFSAQTLEALLVSLQGSEQSLAELNHAAKLITRFYRHRGYLVARAYLPPQTIKDGELTIEVLEGRLGKTVISNHSAVKTSLIEAILQDHLQVGEVMNNERLNQALLLIDDLAGVAQIQGALQAGDAVGLSNLLVTVPADRPYRSAVLLDNAGDRYTGQNRLALYTAVNSPLKRGDELSLQMAVSDEALAYARSEWDMPIGSAGLRAGANLSYSRYRLGDVFESLDAHGTAQSVGLQTSYPLVLTLNRRITANAAIEQRDLKDYLDALKVETEKTVRRLQVSLVANDIGQGRQSQWRVEAWLGKLDIKTPSALSKDQSTAQTNGQYAKVVFAANTVRSLGADWSVYLNVMAQLATNNLDSSEKMNLGGATTVRAYPTGELLADEAILLNAELRTRLLANLTGFIFYDYAQATLNHETFSPADNIRSIGGGGVGVSASVIDNMGLKLSLAWRGSELPQADKDQQPRVWLEASYRF
ncbi:ShlB/FhaC/HecB family hemolysin secretion/activation protein [Agitococcus lubricus]|uniref:Hemolysin activation/secretion protein n=1 Tax=Agitococcus lubricus TaxID=1077255 RepID=A0A2T5IUG7_9GAMM|nr:ShlB/FhaC/HecB family hemolysin secretion/activation protein [Agitococcus lubricus]PTQ87507.1 hemolysin activation/secretion protein [Agitococcus lubricus]